MICVVCKERESMFTYAESMLDYTHGNTQRICKVCYIKKLKETKKNIEEALKDLDA